MTPQHNYPLRRATGAVLCLLAACGCACRNSTPAGRSPLPPQVKINGNTWRVECVSTVAGRFVGMSGRAELAEDAGMLFIYPGRQVLEFCMRGCDIPLDIAFIGSDMKVVAIHTMLVEADRLGRKLYTSVVPAQYALEVPSGALGRAGVQVGHKATFTGDIPPAAKAEPSQ